MKHRPPLTSKEGWGDPTSLGWPEVTTFAISAALLAGVTICTGSVQDGAVALAAVAAAVRAVAGRQGLGPTP